MRNLLVVVFTLLFTAGCAGGIKKNFTIVADPPDSRITVVSGKKLKKQTFRSSDRITVRMPEERRLQAKTYVEVSRNKYAPKKIPLRSIQNGTVLNVTLEKWFPYRLKLRLLNPVKSDTLVYSDKEVSFSLVVGVDAFRMKLENRTPNTLKIIWNSAEFTDFRNRRRRLMHDGVNYRDRSNPIPVQMIPPYGSIEQTLLPVDTVKYNRKKKRYETLPIFRLDSEMALALKGKVFYLFIPVEIDRQIMPYNFKILISDVVKNKR